MLESFVISPVFETAIQKRETGVGVLRLRSSTKSTPQMEREHMREVRQIMIVFCKPVRNDCIQQMTMYSDRVQVAIFRSQTFETRFKSSLTFRLHEKSC
jgi:hypothetical protein